MLISRVKNKYKPVFIPTKILKLIFVLNRAKIRSIYDI